MGGAKTEDTSGGSGDHRTSTKKDGMVKKKNILEKYVENSFLTNNPLSKHTEKVNRDFFENKVKKAGKSKYDNYEDYIRARGRGEVDAYGREITNTGGNDNNNQPILTSAETLPANNMTATAPTNAEITQASSTTMSADEILVANKKKGRSQTILNQAQGLGSSSANTTKKTLGA